VVLTIYDITWQANSANVKDVRAPWRAGCCDMCWGARAGYRVSGSYHRSVICIII